jgi:AraC-like DNA-binding protein
MFFQFGHSGASEYYCKEYGENFNFPYHLHRSFEFITILSGEMRVSVDKREYLLGKGDSLLIFPGQVHSLSSENSSHMLCIFSLESVSAYSSDVDGLVPTDNSFKASDQIISDIDSLSIESPKLRKKGILYSLCAEFDTLSTYVKRDPTDLDLIYRIFDFTEKNYAHEASLSSLAKHTGYSYSYISRAFKNATDISYTAFLNEYRIGKAAELILGTNKSILECALECGYSSLRSFNRNFKDILGMTPCEYRKKN